MIGIGITLPDSVVADGRRTFFNGSGGGDTPVVPSSGFDLLVSGGLTLPSYTFDRTDTDQTTFDYTDSLVTPASDVRAVRDARYAAGVWYDDDGSSNDLHPYETVEANGLSNQKRYLYYDEWATGTSYSTGDRVWFEGTDSGLYCQATNPGTSGASITGSTSDIGSTVSDGVITWSVLGRYQSKLGYEHQPGTTNLCSLSADQSTSSGSNYSVTANATTAPDGTTSAELMIATNSGNLQHRGDVVGFGSVVDTQTYCYSVFVKKKDLDWWAITDFEGALRSTYFDIVNCTVGTSGHDDAGIEDIGGGWCRCWVRLDAAGTTMTIQHHVVNADNAASFDAGGTNPGTYVWGCQLEVGPYPTAYVPTSGSSEVRDECVMRVGTGIETTGAFTMLIDVTPHETATAETCLVGQGTLTNRVEVYIQNSTKNFIFYVTAFSVQATPVGWDFGDRTRVVVRYDPDITNVLQMWVNGSSVGTNTGAAAITSLTGSDMYIGERYNGTQTSNSIFHGVEAKYLSLSDAECVTLSTTGEWPA